MRTLSAKHDARPGRTPCLPSRLTVLCVAVVLALGQLAGGDTIRKKNGVILRGRILSEDQTHVEFEWTQFGTCVVKVARTDILDITRGKYDPPPVRPKPKPKPGPNAGGAKPAKVLRYCYIPIVGEIGVEIKADDFETVVKNALLYRAEVLILMFDSPGGSLQDTHRILAKMGRLKGIRVVALVTRAHSTAAVLAMACPDIFMPPNGTIGDITPFKGGPPNKAAGEFSSADLAAFRTVAQVAKHSPLLLEGMINAEIELSVTTAGGKGVVVKGAGGKVLKKKGRTLTLTGTEALACGLVRGAATTVDEVRKVIDPTRQWYRAWPGGQAFMKKRAARNRLVLLREKYLKSIAPQLASLDKQLAVMTDAARTLESERGRLKRKYDSESDRIEEEYKRQVRRAEDEFIRRMPSYLMRNASPTLYARMAHDALRDRARRIDDAQDDRNSARRRLETRFGGDFRDIDARYKRLDRAARLVRIKKKKLLDAGPKVPK